MKVMMSTQFDKYYLQLISKTPVCKTCFCTYRIFIELKIQNMLAEEKSEKKDLEEITADFHEHDFIG